MEAEKCTFVYLTRTKFDLSPLAEYHSPLAEKINPEALLAENISSPHSKTSRSFLCGTKFSLAKSELCEETPYLHLVHLCFLDQYSLPNKLKVHSEVRHILASASKDLCQLAF